MRIQSPCGVVEWKTSQTRPVEPAFDHRGIFEAYTHDLGTWNPHNQMVGPCKPPL